MWQYNLGLKFHFLAKNNKNSKALITNEITYNFIDLEKRSSQIGNWLIKNNFFLNDRVCISSKKSFDIFSLLIACLKIGISFTFIDHKSPNKRLEKIIAQIKPKAIFADEILINNLNGQKKEISVYNLSKISRNFKMENKNLDQKILNSVPSSTIAYTMFTSGSTGIPKGATISHANVLNFSDWCKEEYDIKIKDVVTNLNPLFFDNSIFDIFGGLFNGAGIIPIESSKLLDPKNLIKYIEKKKATIWFSVPSLLVYLMSFNVIKKNSLLPLKKIIFGGEGFPKNILKKLYSLLGKRINLINVYGPTECTCICSSYKIQPRDFSKNEMLKYAPLGKKLSKNFYSLILNSKMKPVKTGEIGELFIGGQNVGLGYINDKERTAEKFIQNPLNSFYRDTVYKSGDLVYVDPKTQYIYYSARADNQIKFQGYRIELEDIEHAFRSIEGVKEIAVTYGKKNNMDEITCWLVHSTSLDLIKKKIRFLLPSYMIPKNFFELNILPRNQNGKIDKRDIKNKYYD